MPTKKTVTKNKTDTAHKIITVLCGILITMIGWFGKEIYAEQEKQDDRLRAVEGAVEAIKESTVQQRGTDEKLTQILIEMRKEEERKRIEMEEERNGRNR